MSNNGQYLKEIGAKVKAARLKRKMTLQQVYAATGYHYMN